ncbi:MAG: hypothetical protein ACFCAD_17600 [Pleurocapsa sp.]
MKSIKTTAVLALISFGTITAAAIKPAFAQTGYDMWTGNTYDTSNCAGYSNCHVDGYGTVYGTNSTANPGSYTHDNYTLHKTLY